MRKTRIFILTARICAYIELPWPGYPHLRGLHHLVPLRKPADGSRHGEEHRVHGRRDADGLHHDPGVEVHVRVELALDEIPEQICMSIQNEK